MRIKDYLVNVDAKLEQLDQKVDTLNLVANSNKVILDEHIRRTELLEQEFKPIRSHVLQIKGILKFLAALLPILAALIGYAKYFL